MSTTLPNGAFRCTPDFNGASADIWCTYNANITSNVNIYTQSSGAPDPPVAASTSATATSGVVESTLGSSGVNNTITSAPATITPTEATSSTSSASAATTFQQSTAGGKSSVSTSALAGAAVGCFLAGVLIVALVSFFLFKRRAGRSTYTPRGAYIPSADPAYGGEKATPMVSVAALGGFDFLPQQAADAEVRTKLSTVTDQIDQHVENFYTHQSIALNVNLKSELLRFETSQLPQPLAACFENAANPTVLIKHCLAFHIFNLTIAPGEGTQPLLPPELAGTVAAVYNKALSQSASKDVLAAFSSWKTLTKYLRPDLTRASSSSQNNAEKTARIASHFTAVFSPWSNPQYSNEQRDRHLTELINHAMQTAVWLFGQPDTFKFDWTTPAQDTRRGAVGRNLRNVVIVPAVSKVTHNGAKLGGNGQNVLSPVIKAF